VESGHQKTAREDLKIESHWLAEMQACAPFVHGMFITGHFDNVTGSSENWLARRVLCLYFSFGNAHLLHDAFARRFLLWL